MKNPTEPHQYNKMPKSGGNSVRYVVQLTNDTTSIVQDEPFAWVVLNNGVQICLALHLARRIQQLSKSETTNFHEFYNQSDCFQRKNQTKAILASYFIDQKEN